MLEHVGRYRESREAYLRCSVESRRTGSIDKVSQCFTGLASVALELADADSAREYLAAASANLSYSASPSSSPVIRLRIVRGAFALTEKRLDDSRADLDAAIASGKNVYWTMRALLTRAELNLVGNRVGAAEADAKRALALAQSAQGDTPYSNRTGLAWLTLGQVVSRKGDGTGASKAFHAAVENLSNTVDADNPKLLLARQLAHE